MSGPGAYKKMRLLLLGLVLFVYMQQLPRPQKRIQNMEPPPQTGAIATLGKLGDHKGFLSWVWVLETGKALPDAKVGWLEG